MKHKNLLLCVLTAVFVLLFWGYRGYSTFTQDTEPPRIRIPDSQVLELSVAEPQSALLQGIAATDKQDGNITDLLVVERIYLLDKEGNAEVSYAAADKAGNVAKATRTVRYTDYESPRFSLRTPLIYRELQRFDVLADVLATDLIDGDIQHRIRATAITEDSVTAPGIHLISFRVNNSLGDHSEITLPVEVLPSGSYNAELSLTDYLIYLPVGAQFKAKHYLGDFYRGNEITSLSGGLPEDFRLKTEGTVDTSTEGVYTVSYTVTYTLRHPTNPEYDQIYTGYSKLIVVVEG